MRTIVREHNKNKLELRIARMKEQGWRQKSKIIYDDAAFKNSTFTYLCVMERDDKK